MPKFGLMLYAINWSYDEVREVTVEAERLGFDSLWHHDNVVGMTPFRPSVGVMDAWTLLPALAEATERIELGTLVTPVGRRAPAVLAKSTTIVDHISGGGRLNVGLGPGDEDWQFLPWGLAYPPIKQRIALLRDQIEVLRRMWREGEASYVGTHVVLDGAINEPKPLSEPHPMIWVGLVFGKKVMPRVAAEYADGVNIYNGSDEAVTELRDLVRRRCDEIGRDFGSIPMNRIQMLEVVDTDVDLDEQLAIDAHGWGVPEAGLRECHHLFHDAILGPADHVIERLEEKLALGFDHLAFEFGGLDAGSSLWGPSAESVLHAMRRFAAEVMPHFREQDQRSSSRAAQEGDSHAVR
jgi:alkanesulfonate monooxygenase SsuD/methylene tetrahydromethanopterin reductase-like flavin-dependent oxidoreductase (luciferase family)